MNIPVKTMATAATEIETARKRERKGHGKGGDEAPHGYGPHSYTPETPPQWEVVTRLADLPCRNSLVMEDHPDGLTGLKVNGERLANGRVRLALKKKPYNVKPDEVLIPLR